MRIYIAGPYTSPDPDENTRKAIEVADQIVAAGHTPFIPHLYHHWEAVSPKPYSFWTKLDMEWLEQCEAVFRIPGLSAGAEAEVGRAKLLGMPIFNDINELERISDGRE